MYNQLHKTISEIKIPDFKGIANAQLTVALMTTLSIGFLLISLSGMNVSSECTPINN